MNRLFYPKLAATNIKKNAKTYVPYILTCIFTVAMFYMIRSLALNEGIAPDEGRGSSRVYDGYGKLDCRHLCGDISVLHK